MRITITEHQLTKVITDAINEAVGEVRYIDVSGRRGKNTEKSLNMGWENYDELKSKVINSIQNNFGCNVTDLTNKSNNQILLYVDTPDNNIIESIKKYIKSLYGFRYSISFKPNGNGMYVSFYKNTDSNYEPIGKGEKIRVFHGTDIKTAIKIAKNGLSGKERANRTYSYEYGMNPNGLFVTTNFYVAKDFGYHYDDQVIIEFTADSDDLDTPVWNGQDSYFGQNTNPQPFKNRSERISQKIHYQNDAEHSEFPFVAQSDNPAMAERIFNNNENQALYYGDIMPNQIKRFWWKKKGTENYIPLSLRQFIRKFGNYTYDRTEYGRTSTVRIDREKLYYPNESWDGPEGFAERMRKSDAAKGWPWDESTQQYCIDIAKQWESAGYGNEELDMSSLEMMKQFLFPKQMLDILGKDRYREYFDRFYPEFREPGQKV